MFTSIKILILVVCALTVNAEKNFGTNCRNVKCAASQQCLGLYETCKGGLVDGSTCGFYASCVDLEGEIKDSERHASTPNIGNDPKPIPGDVPPPSRASNNHGIYPNLPQPNEPQGGFGGYPQGSYPQNPQAGYYPQNPQGGYYPQNPQAGYYPPNPQGGYYPPNPQGNPNMPPASGNKKDSDSESGFGTSLLNFFSGGDRGSSANSGGPDLGSLLSIIGSSGNKSPPSSSGSGGLDFSSLFNAFTGGNGGSQNTRNDYGNRNPTGQVGPNPSYGGGNRQNQNPSQAEDTGPNILQTLGNFATSPLGQQLLISALRNNNNNNNNNNESAQQNRRYGGLFTENTSRTTQTP